MNGYKNDLPAVEQTGMMNFSGNVIPMQWYKTIIYENGKPDLNAIIILSDIVYWYRPVEVRDEHTGAAIEMRKKFKADKLQRNYSAFSELYGLTKNQVRAGIKKLCDLKVIEIEFRTIHSGDVVCNNVLFINLMPAQLKSVTYPIINDTLPNLNQIGVQFKSDTNTENTSEVSSEITGEESSSTPDPFDTIRLQLQQTTGLLPSGENSIKMINEFVELNITIDDIKEGLKWHIANKGPARYLTSLSGAIKTANSIRVQSAAKVRPPEPPAPIDTPFTREMDRLGML
jgi:hypothetical protein